MTGSKSGCFRDTQMLCSSPVSSEQEMHNQDQPGTIAFKSMWRQILLGEAGCPGSLHVDTPCHWM